MTGQPRIWPVALTALLAIAMLCALGVWQLQRLAGKQTLLTQIETRANSAAVGLDEVLQRQAAGGDVEFLKVAVHGRFVHAAERHLIATFDGAAGWDIVTPLVTPAGQLVLVDRGIVPDELRDPAKRAPSAAPEETDAIGVIRTHGAGRGYFSPDNDATNNVWFWWDVPAMLAAPPLPPGATAIPLVIQLAPLAGDRSFPRPQPAETGLANNHLQYAITWFSLALVLLAVAGLYIRGLMIKTVA